MKIIKILFILVLFSVTQSTYAQSIVSGSVTNDEGDPVFGATVSLKNTDNTFGVLTDRNGVFELNIPQGNYDFEVRYLGYASNQKSVNVNTTPLNLGAIVLVEAAENLQNVEVIGRARTDYNLEL